MAKQKSIEDIFAQQNRILGLVKLDSNTSWNRYRKAMRIGGGYIRNMEKTKSYRKATKGPYANDDDGMWKEYQDYEKAINRKYSQRTYMGLSKG